MAIPSCGNKPGLCEVDQEASVGSTWRKTGEGNTVRLGDEQGLSRMEPTGGLHRGWHIVHS